MSSKLLILAVVALIAVIGVGYVAIRRLGVGIGPGSRIVLPASDHRPRQLEVDLRPQAGIQLIPKYVDLAVGDSIVAIKGNGEKVTIAVERIEVASAARSSPRTKVILRAAKRRYEVWCGMSDRRNGGVGATDVDGLMVAAEVTRLLFQELRGGSSIFLTFEKLRLQNDLRLAIWDGTEGPMPGAGGSFVIDQPAWMRHCFGNWLHSTRYGFHSAIDVYATPHQPPERVLSPVEGVVYRTYNRDASPDDSHRSKAINLYGSAVVGPRGERILYRFFHLSEILVEDGESVARGQVIGLTGHTGFNPRIGDHLHFEMRLNPSLFGLPWDDDLFASIAVNPYPFLLDWYESEREPGSCNRVLRGGAIPEE